MRAKAGSRVTPGSWWGGEAAERMGVPLLRLARGRHKREARSSGLDVLSLELELWVACYVHTVINPSEQPHEAGLLSTPFYRCGNQGTGKLNPCPK